MKDTGLDGSLFHSFSNFLTGTVILTSPQGAYRFTLAALLTSSTSISLLLGKTSSSCASRRNRPNVIVACPHIVLYPSLWQNSTPICTLPDPVSSVTGRKIASYIWAWHTGSSQSLSALCKKRTGKFGVTVGYNSCWLACSMEFNAGDSGGTMVII